MFNLDELFKDKIKTVKETISPELLWERYLGTSATGKRVKIPWRVDNNPSGSLYRSTNLDSGLLFHDHKDGKTYNIFQFLMKLDTTLTSVGKAAEYIYNDFNLNKTMTVLTPPNLSLIKAPNPAVTKKKIVPIFKDWDSNNLRYWRDYGITIDTLNFFEVKPIHSYVIETTDTTGVTHVRNYILDKEIAYAYGFRDITPDEVERYSSYNGLEVFKKYISKKPDYYKIYRPFNKDFKWLNDCPSNVVAGVTQLILLSTLFYAETSTVKAYCDIFKSNVPKNLAEKAVLFTDMQDRLNNLVFTKSLKDIMVYSQEGIIAIAPQSEVSFLNNNTESLLQTICDRVLENSKLSINFDNDSTGKNNALSLVTKNTDLFFPYLLTVPKFNHVKDISDLKCHQPAEFNLFIEKLNEHFKKFKNY